MTDAPSNSYFAEVAEPWAEIRAGYFTEHMRDAAITKAQLPPGQASPLSARAPSLWPPVWRNTPPT